MVARASLAAGLLLVAALAGCSDGDGKLDASDGATATTGILRGLVVDEAIRPIADAQVRATAEGKDLNATTDAGGLFRWTGLEPGAYVVEVSKPFYAPHRQAVVVQAGVDEPELARFQLVFEPASVPFAQVYQYDGFFECGSNIVRACSQPNIATWIVLCAQTGICLGNVTNDRSLLFQHIDGPPSFLQSELVWKETLPTATEFTLLMGGGTEEELRSGVNLPAYNITSGPSPLLGRVTNHEGPDAWCKRVPDPPCEDPVLNNSGIGLTRALLVQVDAGPSIKTPLCGTITPCAVGYSMQQPFTMYTTAFYGYEPPDEWRFALTGTTPPPPGGPP